MFIEFLSALCTHPVPAVPLPPDHSSFRCPDLELGNLNGERFLIEFWLFAYGHNLKYESDVGAGMEQVLDCVQALHGQGRNFKGGSYMSFFHIF